MGFDSVFMIAMGALLFNSLKSARSGSMHGGYLLLLLRSTGAMFGYAYLVTSYFLHRHEMSLWGWVLSRVSMLTSNFIMLLTFYWTCTSVYDVLIFKGVIMDNGSRY